jgi:hypothetical protein
MTNQTESRKSLGGSPAGVSFSRLCTLTLAAILITGGAVAGFGQAQPDAAKPAKPVSEKKPAAEPAEKIAHGYMIHQSIEVGGRMTSTTGSTAMWDTLVNQGSGGRILGQSLELHSVDPSKTPFFDTLSTFSTGYGGDPYDVSRLKISKGRIYDFSGSFRRDRNYFDYNLLDNSLLSTATAATPALVSEPDSLHLFNTVRRNTDATLTLLPLSMVSFRAGMNHGTHEGPSYSTLHYAGDVQLLDWFRNASNTYTGGVDVKLAKRTTVSYDQFFVAYKGDTSFHLTAANYTLSDGTPVSLGVDTLATATCGTGANKTPEVVNGIVNPFCSGTLVATSKAPIRTNFPTEQLRFSSHYWDKVSFNGRFLYSGATSDVNHFNQTFNGWNSRTSYRQEIQTGGMANGQLASNKRISTNGDLGVVAELNRYLSVSDAFNSWNLRTSGNSIMTTELWTGPAGTSMLTPLSTITPTTSSAVNTGFFLDQKLITNTVLATATVTPQFKISGGWRFRNREINSPTATKLAWHENGMLLGGVIQPNRMVRINLNFDNMNSKYASGTAINIEPNTPLALLPSNTFTREAPNKTFHLRARATVKPAKWINFAVTGNDYSAKNTDPQVNHVEHNHDLSFATTIIPMEGLSLDFNYARDDVFSETDICYAFLPNANAPLPAGAANSGACVNSTANPNGSATFYLGNAYYSAPSNFFSGSFNYAPSRYFRLNAGARANIVNGQAEQLNPLMVPGALHSKYVTPFADLQVNIAKEWAWHGNWTHDGYAEGGPQGPLPSRNTHGDIVTLGVKYAF